jgi:two-component system sensor histidine kinase YesM
VINKKIAENTVNSVKQINLNIEKEVKNIDGLIDRIIMNNQIQAYITNTDFKTFDNRLRITYDDLDRLLNNELLSNSIENNVNILLISSRGGFYRFNEKLYLNENELRNSHWYSETIGLTGKINWLGMQKSKSIINSGNYDFNVSRAIISKETFKIIGAIYVSINESIFQPIFSQISSTQTVYVINREGRVLLSSDKKSLSSTMEYMELITSDEQHPGTFSKKIDGKDYLLVYSNSNKYGWRVVSKIPVKALTGEIDKIKALTFCALIICISISLYFLIVVFKDITKPLQYLVSFINEIESGSKTIDLRKFPCYELIKLSNGIVSLVEKNINTTRELHKTETLYHKTHLEKLEAQVNPHFLYNTLNSIKFIAIEKNQETISSLITSFTKLLRNCINTKDILIKVSEEIENLNHYILIQNVIYHNSLQVIFEIDKGLCTYLIPRFILQPLIENSIIHGFERNSSENRIIVRGYMEGQNLIFEVEDNGKGIDKSKIELIMNSAGSKESFTRFGIIGIKERLQLIYGNASEFSIENNVHSGMIVIVKIPVMLNNIVKELIADDQGITC